MSRLSRIESQQVTRVRLIEAAEKDIARLGIYEASVRRICVSAGYTLGAFYSNFKSKDDLLLEVLKIQTEREFETLNTIVSKQAGKKEKEVLAALSTWLKKLGKNKILTDLSLEFELYAKHKASFRKLYNLNRKEWHGKLASVLELLFKGQNLVPRIPPLQMAVGLTALWTGLAVEGTLSVPDSADQVITMFVEALLDSARAK